jgi:hypothetical protein
MADSINVHRDAALRRIGRNVVNFQKLEASLKQILPTLRFAGPLREIKALQAAGAKEVKKKSFGDLASRFHRTLTASECGAPEPSTRTEVTVAHSLRIEPDSTEAAETEKALARLVRERNRLIHSDLVSIDLNSIAACEELSARLDEQNERICGQLNHLQVLRQAQSQALVELKKFIDSDEFLELLSHDSDDA